MINLSTSVTPAAVAANTLIIRSVLQEQDPTLDISTGGAVDSLLANGNAVASANMEALANQTALQQQLQGIAAGTTIVSDTDLDELMTAYYVTRYETVLASGTIEVIVNTNQQYVFNAGYQFNYGSLIFVVPTTTTVYAVGTSVVENDTTKILRQIYDQTTGYLYRFTLSVTAGQSGAASVLAAGDAVIPTPSFAQFGRAYAATNFTGGTIRETNQELATRALSGLAAKSVSGLDSINALLPTIYTNAVGSTVGVDNPIMSRDRNNVFNVSTGGKTDLYVRSGAIATKSYLVDAVVTNVGTRELQITLTRLQSSGVYRQQIVPYFTSTPPVIVSGGVTTTSVVHNPYTYPTGFTPEMVSSYDRAFSATQEIVLTFNDTRQSGSGYVVSITTLGQTIQGVYTVVVEYMPGVEEVWQEMRTDSIRPAGVDMLVKAAVPCVTTLSITAAKPVTYTGPDASTLAAEIASMINALPLRTAVLDVYTVSNLLKQADSTLVLVSVAMQCVIYGQNDTDLSVLQSPAGLVIPTDTTRKISVDDAFFTTTKNLVTVTLA